MSSAAQAINQGNLQGDYLINIEEYNSNLRFTGELSNTLQYEDALEK